MHISQISGYGYESGNMTVSITLSDGDNGIAMTLRNDEVVTLQSTLVRFYQARQKEVSNLVRDKPVTTQLLAPPTELEPEQPSTASINLDDEIPF